MKLDLNAKIKGLDGKEIPGADGLNKFLANYLSLKTKTVEPVKAFDWAMKLFNDGSIEVDRADADTLLSEIKSFDGLNNLTKGQLILRIQECIAAESK